MLFAVSLASVLAGTTSADTYTVPAGTTETVTSANAATYNAYDSVTVPSTAGLDFTGPGATSFTAPLTVKSGGTSVVSNGADVVLGTQTIDIGGEMVLTNATQRRADPVITTGDNWVQTITVGAGGRGILRVEEGTVLTNRLQLGKDYSAGLFVQRGGHVVNLGGTSADAEKTRVAIGRAGSGYYEVRGGTNTLVGTHAIGAGYQGQGVLALYDGLLEAVKGTTTAARLNFFGNTRPAAYYQFGGTATLGEVQLNLWTAWSVLSVFGPKAVFSGSVRAGCGTSSGYLPYLPAVVTFGGGATVTTSLTMGKSINQYGDTFQAVYNLNGVTLRNSGNWSSMLGPTAPKVMRHVVYKGGVIYDTASNPSTFYNSLIGAHGKGVCAINWDPTKTYSASPVIIIEETSESGQGYGASAVAQYDPVSQMVTNVVIVAPGCGYTEATARFVYGSGSSDAYTTELAPNENTGGFKVTGADVQPVHFYSTNYWGGVTEIEKGTVYCDIDFAMPKFTPLRLTGGLLELVGTREEFKSIGGTGGGINRTYNTPLTGTVPVECLDIDTAATLDLSKLTLSVTGRWDVAAADLATGKFADYTSTIVFADTATVAIAGDLPETDRPIKLAQATSLTGAPTLADPLVAKDWKLVVRDNALYLKPVHGIMVIVR